MPRSGKAAHRIIFAGTNRTVLMKGKVCSDCKLQPSPSSLFRLPRLPAVNAANTGNNTCEGCLVFAYSLHRTVNFARKHIGVQVFEELKRPGLNFTQEHCAILAGSED